MKIPQGHISIKSLTAILKKHGGGPDSRAGIIAAAKTANWLVIGDWLHLPKTAEPDFLREALLASAAIKSQRERADRDKARATLIEAARVELGGIRI